MVGVTVAPVLRKHVERGLQQFRTRVLQQHVAAGHGDRHGIGAGLDAVGQHGVARAVQLGDALDDDTPGAGAGNARAHLVEAIGDVGDLGLLRRVLDHGRAVGERRRHDRGVGAADGDFRENDLAAAQAVRRARHHIAAVDLDLGAELLDRHDEKIDRPRADGAAAGHRHPRFAHARKQRRQHPKACPHFGDQLIGRGGVDDAGGGNVQRLAVIGGFAGALAARHDVDAVIAEDALEQRHVGEPRHIVEDQGLVGEQARDHQRQRRVLRARDRDGAVERPAADNTNAIHIYPRDAQGRTAADRDLTRYFSYTPFALCPGRKTGAKRNPRRN